MNKIKIRKINEYSADIRLNNKTYRITDVKAKRIKYYQTQGVILWTISFIIGIIAVIAFLGTVGHSDYCAETGIVDTLTTFDYFIRCSIELGIVTICYKGCTLGRNLVNYNG